MFAHVIAFERVLADTLPTFHNASNVMVAEAFNPVFSRTTVSWANGKLAAAGVPPDEVAQAVSDQLPPPTRFQ